MPRRLISIVIVEIIVCSLVAIALVEAIVA